MGTAWGSEGMFWKAVIPGQFRSESEWLGIFKIQGRISI